MNINFYATPLLSAGCGSVIGSVRSLAINVNEQACFVTALCTVKDLYDP